MKHMRTMKSNDLVSVEIKKLSTIVSDLLTISQEHAYTALKSMPEYISFCQDFIIKLLTLKSTDHNQYGIELLHTLFGLVHASESVSCAVTVKGAGLVPCDGLYVLESPSKDKDGFLIPSTTIQYVRRVKPTKRMFMIILDSTLGAKRMWSLSEEFKPDDGALEYEDYYTNLPERIQYNPPLSEWTASNKDDVPAPTIEPVEGAAAPVRDEHSRLAEGVARWFIEKNVLKLVLGMDDVFFSHSFLMKTLDALMNGRDFVSYEMIEQFGSVLPANRANLTEDACSSIKLIAIEAAKKSLTSVQRCQGDLLKQQTALESVSQALDFVACLEKSTKSQSKEEASYDYVSSKANATKSPSLAASAPKSTDSNSSASLDEHDTLPSDAAPKSSITTRRQILTGRSMRAGMVSFRRSSQDKFEKAARASSKKTQGKF